jgi:ketosteroid isomerase-like protein
MADATGEASKEVVRQFFAAVQADDRDKVRDFFTPDAKLWVSAGPPRWGAVGTLDDWFGLVDNFGQVVGGQGKTLFGPFFAEGEHVSMQIQPTIPLDNGRIYSGHYHWYFQVRDGKILQIREYYDTLHFVESALGTPALPEFELRSEHPERGTNLFEGARESL